MLKELPKGWVETTLGEIAEPSRERALPAQFPGMRYVGLEHIEPQTMRLLGHGYAHDARSSSVCFSKGEVLYGKMRPYLNKVWVAEFDGLCSAEFLVFKKLDGLNSHFLAMRLNAEDFVTFANAQVSGERPRVDFQKLSPFSLLLPPAEEQDRIAAKLDAALTRMANGERAARRALERLQRYRSAVLHAAVTGELTREWRETQRKDRKAGLETGEALLQRLLAARRARWEETELRRLRSVGKAPKDDKWKSRYPEPIPPRTEDLPNLPKGWIWASLDQIGELNRGKSKHRPCDDTRLYGGPYPFIQTGDIRKSGGTIREHTQTYSEFGLKQSRLWPAGTLCITIAANIAETGILSYPVCFPDSVVGFVQDDTLLKVRFVEFFIRSEKSELERYAPATAQKNINLELLKGLSIPLPPFAEQSEIVREVERRLSAADRLAASLGQQVTSTRGTRQSLLREAFAGRLVPQDPKDEPASALLKRIRTARETEAKKPKGKPMPKSRSKKKVTHRPLLDVLREHRKPMTPEQLFRESGYEAAFNESDAPQDLVDAFYKELRKLTDKPVKVAERKDSGQQAWLRVLP